MNRLQEIEERLSAIKGEIDAEGADLDALEKEIKSLKEERKAILDKADKRKALLDDVANMPARVIKDFKPGMEERKTEFTKDNVLEAVEYRSAFLKTLQGKDLSEVEQRALTTAINSAGAAVPKITLNKIIEKLQQTSVLFSEITVSYVPGNLSLVVANAKNAASWKAEGVDGTPVEDTVVNVNLTGYELIKLVEISAAAQAMTIDAFEAYIAAELGKQMAIAIENAIISGDGDGEPTGILEGVTFTAGQNLVEWAASGKVDYDTLVDGISSLPTMYHQNACFCMNRKMLGEVRKIKDDLKQPIFVYNPQDAAKNAILGYRVIVNDYMPNDTILFCDHSYYYMNFAQSPTIESDRSVGFRSGKITYRGLAVADGKPSLGEAFVKIAKAQA